MITQPAVLGAKSYLTVAAVAKTFVFHYEGGRGVRSRFQIWRKDFLDKFIYGHSVLLIMFSSDQTR